MTETQRKKKLKEPLKLILRKEETLQEIGSYRLTLFNVYVLVSTVLLFTVIVVFLLVFFTPLKRLVPGFADVHNNPEYVKLEQQVEELSREIDDQNFYIQRVQELLSTIPDENARLEEFAPAEQGAPPLASEGLPGSREPITVAALNRVPDESSLAYLFIVPPLRGEVSAAFDAESGHMGVDIVAPRNTPVKAIMDGYIIASDWTLETGNTVGILHANNTVSYYKHNARNLKSLGSFVQAGEAVAIIGNTGEFSSGPHLHFELWVDSKPVDPTRFVSFE